MSDLTQTSLLESSFAHFSQLSGCVIVPSSACGGSGQHNSWLVGNTPLGCEIEITRESWRPMSGFAQWSSQCLAAFDLATRTTQITEFCLLIGWSILRANGKTDFSYQGCSGCQIERGLLSLLQACSRQL